MLGFLLTLVIATIITPVVIKLYQKKGWVKDQNAKIRAKNTHKTLVPRGGGVVIFLSILISTLLFLQIDHYLVAILVGALILTITGILDDIYDLSPIIRIFTGLITALIVVGSGIGIAYISNPFGEGVIHLNSIILSFDLFGQTRNIWVLADLFALFFILWNMNIVNWSKGVAGQMPGFVAIALILIGTLSLRFIDDPTQFDTAHFSFIIAGAYLGFLFWNWPPQKIMPGYGAGSLAGYFLSILAIVGGAKVATTLMVLAVPTADAIFTIARRIIAGKSPLKGDRGHLHHKLIDVLNWDEKKISVFYWLTSLILGILSLYLNPLGKAITILLVTVGVFAFLIWAKIKTLAAERNNQNVKVKK